MVARAQDGHLCFVPGFGLNRYQKADSTAKRQECHASNVTPPMSSLRQADGLRQRRLHRQRNAGEFVGAGDMPRDRGID